MPETIALPLLGPTKKTTALALGGGLVLVVGIGYYRSKKTASTTAADTTSAAATDQNIDPATGYAYGSAEDQAAQAALAASVGAGPYANVGGANTSGGTSPQGYTSNPAWSQAAEDYLVNTVHSGENADVIGNALGKYITGQELTGDQVAIIEQAIAFVGYPPVNGPLGYPPSYRTAQPSSGSSGGSSSGGTLTAPAAPSISAIDQHGATVRWTAVPGAAHYSIFYKLGSAAQVHHAGTAGGTSFRIGYFKPGTRVTVWLNAVDASGHQGPPSSATTFATHH